jgi:hypothetical protein
VSCRRRTVTAIIGTMIASHTNAPTPVDISTSVPEPV